MGPVNILKDIEIIETGLWFPSKKILIIGDIHLGYEEALYKKGFEIPRIQFKDTLKSINKILAKIKPNLILINGDLKHEFGKISDQEWIDVSKFLDVLKKHAKKIILIKGNHDVILKPIADKKELKIVDQYFFTLSKIVINGQPNKKIRLLKKVAVLHGDKILPNNKLRDIDLVIIGNEHPAVVLEDGLKKEKFKCFLLGKWLGKQLIVMPSFFPMIEGTDIRKGKFLSPYLSKGLDNFEVFILGDTAYKFGKLKDI